MYSISTKVAQRQRGDVLILTDLIQGCRYELAGPVAEIWLNLKNGLQEDRIIEFLRSQYGNEAVSYWNHYIRQFLEAGLILETEQLELREKRIEFVPLIEEVYINKAGLVITERCNLKCIHCYNGSDVCNPTMTLQDWERVILQLKKLGCLEIMITGGEPFLHPDLFSILDMLEEHEFVFEINTNGSLITEEKIQRLKKYNFLKHITISLYGLTTSTYQTVTRRMIQPTELVQVYKNMLTEGIQVGLKYIHLTQNYQDALQLANFESNHSIKINKLLELIHSPLNGGHTKDLNLTFEQIHTLYKRNNIELNTNTNPLLQCGRERCSINSYGEVSICEKLSNVVFGNIKEKSLPEIWNGKEIEEFLSHCHPSDQCKNCSNQKYCPRCNGLSYLETGSPNRSIKYLCDMAEWNRKITDNC